MRRIVLLGASGSIGSSTLEVLSQHPQQFTLVGFSVYHNVEAAVKIHQKYPDAIVCLKDLVASQRFKEAFPSAHIVYDELGLLTLATLEQCDLLVNALVGFAGLKPTLAAIKAGKPVALANKETLVAAGQLVQSYLNKYQGTMIPIDSEHSAIYQCLIGSQSPFKKIILTASGGSFRDKTREQLKDVTVEEALNHPNWSMGAKITIDSATMMNKAFEILEARWLFNARKDQIDVWMHRQSIVHSLVEFEDRAVMAQLGTPDMKVPIQFALTTPLRMPLQTDCLTVDMCRNLTFEPIDFNRFPILKLAFDLLSEVDSKAAVMNGANEVAVAAFLRGTCRFVDIDQFVIDVVAKADHFAIHTYEDALRADQLGRQLMLDALKGVNV